MRMQSCASHRHGDRSTPAHKLGARYRHGAGPAKKCLQASPQRVAACALRSRKTQPPRSRTQPAPRLRVGLSQGACVRQPQRTRRSARQPAGAGPPRQQHEHPRGYKRHGRHGGASTRGVRHRCARRCDACHAPPLRANRIPGSVEMRLRAPTARIVTEDCVFPGLDAV